MEFPQRFLTTIQRYVAVTAIGPSSLRNQGAPGVIAAAREFLAALDLSVFVNGDRRQFQSRLDLETDALLQAMPKKARHWGAARKAANLFLRDALYNEYLSSKHNLGRLESWLEIPLDSYVAKGLKDELGKAAVPTWPGLKELTPSVSMRYQAAAESLAKTLRLARVHLDIHLWLRERE